MTSDTRTEILELGARWAKAERSADTATLDALAADASGWWARSASYSTRHNGSTATRPAGSSPARSSGTT